MLRRPPNQITGVSCLGETDTSHQDVAGERPSNCLSWDRGATPMASLGQRQDEC